MCKKTLHYVWFHLQIFALWTSCDYYPLHLGICYIIPKWSKKTSQLFILWTKLQNLYVHRSIKLSLPRALSSKKKKKLSCLNISVKTRK